MSLTPSSATVSRPDHPYGTDSKALDTGESFEQTWDKEFEHFNKTVKESDDYEKFYKKLRNDFKTGGSANASFLGILSGGATGSLENDFESLSEDQKRSIKKFFDEAKQTGLDKGTLKNAAYRRFTGEDYVKGARPKPLELFRVSTQDLSRAMELSAVDTRWVGSVNVGSDYRFNLSGVGDSYGEIRLGMITAYCGKDLPEGFVWADGTTPWPSEAWVPEHLRGQPVPNFNGRVARGATSAGSVGTSGGSDLVPSHSTKSDGQHIHRVPDHAHGLGGILSGPISARGGPINGARYLIKDDGAGWRLNAGGGAHHIEVGGGDNDEGQHRHELEGGTIGAGVLSTVNGDGVHAHLIDAVAYVPNHVAVRYIIRIK